MQVVQGILFVKSSDW